jgi:sterol desaturase/sphingolipid hydroxylase (fatty acid hydroxylase superfamily)
MMAAAASASLSWCSRVYAALCIIAVQPSFWIRVGASGVVGTSLYLLFGFFISRAVPRAVAREVLSLSPRSDLGLALVSLVFGTLVISAFGVAHEQWGILLVYNDIAEHGWGYYFLSIPLYLLLWDFVFYVLHLALHIEPIYSYSHANHHAFRPPTAWSGIAIDPIESVFSGLAPYLCPLFVAPFHLPTVYVINVLLVAWALLLHSSAPWPGTWLFVGTVTHNMHHARGKSNNGNFGAIFKIYDRIFGTLVDESKLPYWMEVEEAQRKQSTAAAADDATDAAAAKRATVAARRKSPRTSPARRAYASAL